ncbi:MAG TPA: O-acetyl-ADP-ribose deacetylase [Pyrinomonadaceae bacterium]|jgi:O-acetyl-ADP-ribose deacetylase (regulator of RNase III)
MMKKSLTEEALETFLNGRVKVLVGDITRQSVDALVNAANSSLLGGGGVDGAIHSAGGPLILEECRAIRRNLYPDGLPAGEAVITTGGQLPARYVIHTVGPVYGMHGGEEPEILSACYRNSLQLAINHALSSLAFPAISTGAFYYPRHEAAIVSSGAIKAFLENDDKLREVRLVFFKPSDAEMFLRHHRFD